jgi:hypothetical protein
VKELLSGVHLGYTSVENIPWLNWRASMLNGVKRDESGEEKKGWEKTKF